MDTLLNPQNELKYLYKGKKYWVKKNTKIRVQAPHNYKLTDNNVTLLSLNLSKHT